MSANHLEEEIEQVVQDIKGLKKVQGNTNIAKTCAKTLLTYITHSKPQDFQKFVEEIKKYGNELANARPNEPLAVNAVAFITKDLEKCENQQQVRIKAIERIEQFFKYVDESYEIIRVNAVNLLKGYKSFYNHCHSTLARDILVKIHDFNPDIIIINDETRPLLQGRITVQKLAELNIKIIHTLDAAVGSLFLNDLYPTPEVVIVGCDGFTLNGDIVNKVGTLNTALAAKEAGVPFYVATQFMKVDMRSKNGGILPIEQRDPDEVWKDRPKNVEIINPAFDLVPAKFITGGLITEKGLIKPEDVKKHLS